ncbi:hypothetical protein BT96DRAFT_944797 [Gymnopus androsaceus JB14]|uniref:Uncharacterized protein n=1 Tax=Gymnopus androsaceus JB14 TaxID=1447944 RepID=A0A6A4H384_9AGAR|nr:hypothetical protein BT96DRAFT_944797 [Gymnopus androsaceus JB14]
MKITSNDTSQIPVTKAQELQNFVRSERDSVKRKMGQGGLTATRIERHAKRLRKFEDLHQDREVLEIEASDSHPPSYDYRTPPIGVLSREKFCGVTKVLALFFPATKAEQMGLVSKVVDGGRKEVVAAALDLAKLIATKSPVAVSGTKRLISHARDHSEFGVYIYLELCYASDKGYDGKLGCDQGETTREFFTAKLQSWTQPVFVRSRVNDRLAYSLDAGELSYHRCVTEIRQQTYYTCNLVFKFPLDPDIPLLDKTFHQGLVNGSLYDEDFSGFEVNFIQCQLMNTASRIRLEKYEVRTLSWLSYHLYAIIACHDDIEAFRISNLPASEKNKQTQYKLEIDRRQMVPGTSANNITIAAPSSLINSVRGAGFQDIRIRLQMSSTHC